MQNKSIIKSYDDSQQRIHSKLWISRWLINAFIGSLLHNCYKSPSYLQLEIKLQSIDIAFDIYNGVFKGQTVTAVRMFSSWLIGVCYYLAMVFMLIIFAGMYNIVFACWKHGNLMAISWDGYITGVLVSEAYICSISLVTILNTQSIKLMPIQSLQVHHFELICRIFLKI